jgi:hypothetical protein
MLSHQGETISFIILELGTFVIFAVEIKDGRSVKGVVIYPTPCSPLNVNRRFGGIFCLHIQGWRISQARNQHETENAVTSKKTELFKL